MPDTGVRPAVLGRHRAPGGTRAAAAHHRPRLLPLPGARRRPRRVRAPAGDRGHDRLGDRPAARPWTSPTRWWPTWAPGPARSHWPSPRRCPRARVHAVEADPLARQWAERNIASVRRGLAAHRGPGDAARRGLRPWPCLTWTALVDLVVSNPPYIPAGAWVPPEVGEYDPATALWGGRTASTRSGSSRQRHGACCGPAAWSPWSTGPSRARPSTGCSPRRAAGGRRATTCDLAGRDRFVTAARP